MMPQPGNPDTTRRPPAAGDRPRRPARRSSSSAARPYRSLGLSLSVLGAFFFLGVFALLPAALVILLRLEGRVFEPRNGAFWAVPVSALALMTVSVFAWAGRPRRARVIFIVLTVLAAVLALVTAFRPDLMDFVSDGAGGIVFGSSLEPIFSSYLRCLLIPRLLIAVFIVWYCRRPVVRAFFGEA